MADGEFEPFRLDGGRFAEAASGDPGFPLEAIDELRRYERLLLEVARGLWMQENPERERAPRRFSERLRLRLVGVQGGSVAPVLAPLEGAANQLFGDGLLERSSTAVSDALEAIVKGDRLPNDFPASATSSLVQLGSGLHDDEWYAFPSGNGGGDVQYTQEHRRHLLDVTLGETITVEGELIGRINEIHADNQTFEFIDRAGRQARGSFERTELFDEIKSLTKPEREAVVVRLVGRYSTDRAGNLTVIENVDDVDSFVSSDDAMGGRLRDLLELPEAWDDAGAHPPSTRAVEEARDLLAQIDDETREQIVVFPTVDGGVSIECQVGARRWSLEVERNGASHLVIVDPDQGRPTSAEDVNPTATLDALKDFLNA